MSVDRVPATRRTQAVQSRPDDARKLPAAGETVLLTCDELAGDDLVMKTENGVSLRLTGVSWLSSQLRSGDTLPVRVVATHPVLELELYGPPTREASTVGGPAAGSALNMSRHSAMRLDQAELRTISWRLPSARALASVWRALAQERWSKPASGADPWMIPVYALGGVQILLRMVEPDPEVRPRPSRRRPLAVRLELTHPTLGAILIELRWMPGGVHLALAVEQPAAVQPVRDALPGVAAAMATANLRLACVSLVQGAAAVARLRSAPVPLPQRAFETEMLSPGLFRAAAETAVLLLQAPRHAARPSPESR